MSYWSEHPEEWDDLCCQGITAKILSELPITYIESRQEEATLASIIEDVLIDWSHEVSFRGVFRALEQWAQKDITRVEEQFWAEKVDDAYHN